MFGGTVQLGLVSLNTLRVILVSTLSVTRIWLSDTMKFSKSVFMLSDTMVILLDFRDTMI